MSSLGSHPGAILFRLSIMIILIVIMMVVFFSYLDATEKKLEQTSVLQTRKIIDSALAVVFATYAVKGRLSELNDLDGGNPFVLLEEYGILAPGYQGAIDNDLRDDQAPGWYYLSHRGHVAYNSRFVETDSYFALVLNYADLDESGRFEPDTDNFQNLQFVKITRP